MSGDIVTERKDGLGGPAAIVSAGALLDAGRMLSVRSHRVVAIPSSIGHRGRCAPRRRVTGSGSGRVTGEVPGGASFAHAGAPSSAQAG